MKKAPCCQAGLKKRRFQVSTHGSSVLSERFERALVFKGHAGGLTKAFKDPWFSVHGEREGMAARKNPANGPVIQEAS